MEGIKYKTSIELQIKLVDLNNRMETICGKFLINDMSDTPNIMGLDILSKTEIIISGRDGIWKFKKNKSKEDRLMKELKMQEDFMELGDKIFQTVDIAKNDKSRINVNSSSAEILSMKDWHPRQ